MALSKFDTRNEQKQKETVVLRDSETNKTVNVPRNNKPTITKETGTAQEEINDEKHDESVSASSTKGVGSNH